MFKKTALENGLRVLIAPMQGTNTVTALVMCATGSDYERPEEGGISHFLEHMFFKGTANRPNAAQLRQELDAMGAISNAFTSHETTGYYIKAAKTYLDASLDILADIYRNSLLPEEEIEREKQVVIEEMHLRRDTPTTYVGDLWEKVLWGDQPAGRDVAGEEATVRRFRRRDFVEYFSHQYVAGNTAVVVAGNFEEDEALTRIRSLFADIRHSPPRPKPPVVEPQAAPVLLVEERKTDQTHLLIGFRGYDAFHPSRYAAEVLATVLGGNWSSRMFSRIREELGLAYAVGSESENYSNRGFITTYAGIAHESTAKTLAAVLEEYRRMRREGPSETELRRTKDFIRGRMLMALETSNAVASFVGGEEMLTGEPLTPEEVFARIEGVGPSDVQAAAEELFRPERLNAVLLGPAPNAGRLRASLASFA